MINMDSLTLACLLEVSTKKNWLKRIFAVWDFSKRNIHETKNISSKTKRSCISTQKFVELLSNFDEFLMMYWLTSSVSVVLINNLVSVLRCVQFIIPVCEIWNGLEYFLIHSVCTKLSLRNWRGMPSVLDESLHRKTFPEQQKISGFKHGCMKKEVYSSFKSPLFNAWCKTFFYSTGCLTKCRHILFLSALSVPDISWKWNTKVKRVHAKMSHHTAKNADSTVVSVKVPDKSLWKCLLNNPSFITYNIPRNHQLWELF